MEDRDSHNINDVYKEFGTDKKVKIEMDREMAEALYDALGVQLGIGRGVEREEPVEPAEPVQPTQQPTSDNPWSS